MAEADIIQVFLTKAERSRAGAESEFISDRYDNCANRCYYACFQAAIAALAREGIVSGGTRRQWSHGFVQAQFVGQLINRRKAYSAELRELLVDTMALRLTADYSTKHVNRREASQAVFRTRAFIEAVHRRGETR